MRFGLCDFWLFKPARSELTLVQGLLELKKPFPLECFETVELLLIDLVIRSGSLLLPYKIGSFLEELCLRVCTSKTVQHLSGEYEVVVTERIQCNQDVP